MESVKSLKHINILKYFLVILISSTLLAISAKLKIPFYPVPMTMQTLVVLLLGILFGWKLGVATVLLYLFEGVIGLPVFVYCFILIIYVTLNHYQRGGKNFLMV